jgi:hypothetical protein
VRTTLPAFLTEAQIERCVAIIQNTERPARRICDEVIAPNLAEINRKLGQENNAMYLAYAVEYVLTQIKVSS